MTRAAIRRFIAFSSSPSHGHQHLGQRDWEGSLSSDQSLSGPRGVGSKSVHTRLIRWRDDGDRTLMSCPAPPPLRASGSTGDAVVHDFRVGACGDHHLWRPALVPFDCPDATQQNVRARAALRSVRDQIGRSRSRADAVPRQASTTGPSQRGGLTPLADRLYRPNSYRIRSFPSPSQSAELMNEGEWAGVQTDRLPRDTCAAGGRGGS